MELKRQNARRAGLLLCLAFAPALYAFVGTRCEPGGLSRGRWLRAEEKQTGHQVKNAGNFKMDPEEMALQDRVRAHQEAAPKLDAATEVRSLVQYNHGFAVMSTNSASMPGYPGGSVVGFAVDDVGRPLFSFSSMSSHTQDLIKDQRCSLTVASKEFKGAADGRVNLLGEAVPLESEEEIAEAKKLYLAKHPKAFWVEFGDFTWYRMEVQNVRFVGGFARAASMKSGLPRLPPKVTCRSLFFGQQDQRFLQMRALQMQEYFEALLRYIPYVDQCEALREFLCSVDVSQMSYDALLDLEQALGRGGPEISVDARLIAALPQREAALKTGCCVICQELMEKDEDVRVLPCGHEYHFECIAQWIPQSNTCCVCHSMAVPPGDCQELGESREVVA